jgi:hypothetical protein
MSSKSLAILVTSSLHPEYVLMLARAASDKGKSVRIHFSGQGVKLAVRSLLTELSSTAKVSVCREGLEDSDNDLLEEGGIPPELFAPCSRLAELVENCDRYVVF